MHWQQVSSLDKGKFYIHGNLDLFRNLTGWKGPRVLYFGDHVYADLADAAMQHGWRTAAIIPEIENEVKIQRKREIDTKREREKRPEGKERGRKNNLLTFGRTNNDTLSVASL